MAERYTAEDFANAKFAEHEDGNIGFRSVQFHAFPWATANGATRSDEEMASDDGWVPVPTKPVLTEGSAGRHSHLLGPDVETPRVIDYLEALGIEVIPDPAPTNTDRLEQLIRESGYSITYAGHHADARALAETLAYDGVTAPKED